jgi:hypothetical protein
MVVCLVAMVSKVSGEVLSRKGETNS